MLLQLKNNRIKKIHDSLAALWIIDENWKNIMETIVVKKVMCLPWGMGFKLLLKLTQIMEEQAHSKVNLKIVETSENLSHNFQIHLST